MDDDKVTFTTINYFVCHYCSYLVRGQHRDGYKNGCSLIKNDAEKYARVDWG